MKKTKKINNIEALQLTLKENISHADMPWFE